MQSFMAKMNPQGDNTQPEDGAQWWMKYLGKGAGVIGGGAAIFFGVWCCITLSPLCLVSGIWQIAAGFLVIVLEAPFCCFCLDFVMKFAGLMDHRPVWQKALLYLLISLPPIFLCLGLSTLIGSGLILACAILHGMQVLGRKGSKEDMAAAARADGDFQDDERIYDNEQLP